MTRASTKQPYRVLAALTDTTWAITESMHDRMLDIASRFAADPKTELAALRTEQGRELSEDSRVRMRGRTAIVPIRGPIVRYASWLNDVCGISSYDAIVADVSTAVADPRVERVILEINSPGGEVTGCSEAAHAIAAMCATKPITAYVDGDCCSAAYWLASATDEIVGWSTSNVGCVGVLARWIDTSAIDEKMGIRRGHIVSSQTPYKVSDPSDTDGRARLQAIIDATADAFLDDLAKFRLLDRANAAELTGKGDVFVGQAALDLGLIDRLATFEDYLADLEKPAVDPANSNDASPTGSFPSQTNSGGQTAAKARSNSMPKPAKDELTQTSAAAALLAAANLNPQGKASDETVEDEEAEDDEEEKPAGKKAKAKGKAENLDEEDEEEASEDEEEKPAGKKAKATGPMTEKQRIAAILSLPAAAGREELAKAFAFDTDMKPSAVAKLLEAAPKAGSKGATKAQFDAALTAGNPDLGAGQNTSKVSSNPEAAALIAAAKELGLA